MKKLILIFVLLAGLKSFGQYDFTACTSNVVGQDSVNVHYLHAYDSMILLQSETQLTINYFRGRTTFVHGHKALEEDDNFNKPTLIIKKCYKGYKLDIDKKRINAILGPSCGGVSAQLPTNITLQGND